MFDILLGLFHAVRGCLFGLGYAYPFISIISFLAMITSRVPEDVTKYSLLFAVSPATTLIRVRWLAEYECTAIKVNSSQLAWLTRPVLVLGGVLCVALMGIDYPKSSAVDPLLLVSLSHLRARIPSNHRPGGLSLITFIVCRTRGPDVGSNATQVPSLDIFTLNSCVSEYGNAKLVLTTPPIIFLPVIPPEQQPWKSPRIAWLCLLTEASVTPR
jgi:hypothetical protein